MIAYVKPLQYFYTFCSIRGFLEDSFFFLYCLLMYYEDESVKGHACLNTLLCIFHHKLRYC